MENTDVIDVEFKEVADNTKTEELSIDKPVDDNPSTDEHASEYKADEETMEKIDPYVETPSEAINNALKYSGINLSDDEVSDLLKLVLEFYNNRNIKVYDRLPKMIKTAVDNYHKQAIVHRIRVNSKELIAQAILNTIIHSNGFETSLTDMTSEFKKKMAEFNKEMREILDKNYQELFDKIDEFKETDPEKADKLIKVKEGFEAAQNLDILINYLNSDTPKNIKRYHQHYNSEVVDFYSKININAINMHFSALNGITDKMFGFITSYVKNNHLDYTTDEIKSFIVLLVRATKNLDYNDLKNITYIHKLLDSIYEYGKTPNQKSYAMVKEIIKVLDMIREIINKSNTDKRKRGK